MKKNNAQKRKTKYAKPEIKRYTVEELAKGCSFEVFGLLIPSQNWGTPCCPT